jgi:hypothetical protein
MANNRHTRLNSLLANVNNFKFALAVGHGQHEPSLPPVFVPKDTYVIFTTKPGYLGDTSDTFNTKFQTIFQNPNKVRQLLRGNLPPVEKPSLLTNKLWNWKKHIYPPGALIANHSLEFYDSPRPNSAPNVARGAIYFNELAGLWKVGIPGREFHGTKQNLQDIINRARSGQTGKLIVFISGCRGDPAVSEQSIAQASSMSPIAFKKYFQVPQNYNIPFTNYIRAVTSFENQSSRYMRLKRGGSNSNSNGRRVRRGVTNSSNNSETSPNINSGNSTVLNKYKRMITRIQEPTFGLVGNKRYPVQSARRYFPSFFNRSMTNENVLSLVDSIKRNNSNLTNRMTTLWKYEPVNQTWKNNRSLALRLLYRIKNLER